MKPEEKFFVLKGIREDFHWYEREEGYWLYEKELGPLYFYKDKKEADSECEKYRKKYREAISHYKEGDTVWFLYEDHIYVGEIKRITLNMCYEINDCDASLTNNELFKSKEELINYLESNTVYLVARKS